MMFMNTLASVVYACKGSALQVATQDVETACVAASVWPGHGQSV